MSSIVNNMIYDMIFDSESNVIQSIDLHYKGTFSCAGGTTPSPDIYGDWYFVNVEGILPAPIGLCREGDALVYNGTQWERTAVMKAGVSMVNGKTGSVTLLSDDISDVTSIKKFISQIEKDKLSTIETGAQVNDTESEIKIKYESNPDTNAYTDAEKAKLALIPIDAEKNTIETIKLNGVPLIPDGTGAVDVIIGSVFKYIASVPTLADLPTATAQTGHVYRVVSEGFNYVFNESGTWDSLGGDVDLTNFYTKAEVYSKVESDTLLSNKVDKVAGKQLTTEDYTTIEKTKLSTIEESAQKNTGKVKVSLTDLVESELYNKIAPGSNISIAIIDVGGDEKLEISSTASGGTGTVDSVNGVLPVAGNITLTKTDIGLQNVTNHQQIPMSYLDIDGTLISNSDLKVPTQKAVRTYVGSMSSINAHGVANMPTLTDNGDGTITIGSDGIVAFYKDANAMTGLVRLSVVSGTTLTMVNNTINYIYCDYNAGTPVYYTTTTYSQYYSNAQYTPVCRVSREGTKLTIITYGNYANGLASKALLKDSIINNFNRESGLVLTTSAVRIISITTGTVWIGINQITTLPALSSDSIGTTMYEYYKVAGTWTKSTPLTSYDSTYYSDDSDRLTLSNGQWVSKYIFKSMGSLNEVYYVSGNAYSTKALAIAEQIPSLPAHILGTSVCVGKIVIQKDASIGTVYARNWKNINLNTIIVEHDNMNGINQVGLGIQKGHISDQAETIYGIKTFDSNVISTDFKITGMTGSNVIVNESIKNTLINIDNVFTATKDSTGFANPENVMVSYNPSTRTVTLTGDTTSYYRGKPVSSLVSGWVSTPHSSGYGTYYLYYNGSAFVWSPTQPEYYQLHIAYVIYEENHKLSIKETHGVMPYSSHRLNHEINGTYLSSGGDISNLIISSTINADRRPVISSSLITDEDNITTLDSLDTFLYTRMNMVGNDYDITFSNTDIVSLNGSIPYFNEYSGGSWIQTPMTNDTYQVIFLIGIPTSFDVDSKKYRYVFLQGQKEFKSLYQANSYETGDNELFSFKTKFPEFVYFGKIIIRYINSNWSIVSYEKLYGYRNKQLHTYSSPYLTDVYVDNSIEGTGNIDEPLSISNTTVVFTNKTIRGGTF